MMSSILHHFLDLHKKKTQNDLKEETLGGMSFHWFRARIGNVGIFVGSLTDPHIEALILAVLKIATTRRQKRNDEMRTVSVNSSTNAKISGEKNCWAPSSDEEIQVAQRLDCTDFLQPKTVKLAGGCTTELKNIGKLDHFPQFFGG